MADDQTIVWRDGRSLIVACPPAIRDRIEVRGIGIVDWPAIAEARLALVIDLVDATEVERLPEDRTETILGLEIPRLALAPFEPSAAVKVALAIDRAAARISKP